MQSGAEKPSTYTLCRPAAPQWSAPLLIIIYAAAVNAPRLLGHAWTYPALRITASAVLAASTRSVAAFTAIAALSFLDLYTQHVGLISYALYIFYVIAAGYIAVQRLRGHSPSYRAAYIMERLGTNKCRALLLSTAALAAALLSPAPPTLPEAAAAAALAPPLLAAYDTPIAAAALAIGLYTPEALIPPLLAAAAVPPMQARDGEDRAGVTLGAVRSILLRSPPTVLNPWKCVGKWCWARPLHTCPYSLPMEIKQSTPHKLVTGATGSGKSTLLASLARGLAQRPDKAYRLIIIDPHGEYGQRLRDIDPIVVDAARVRLNPLSLAEGEKPENRAAELTAILASLYSLGPLQQQVLYEAILDAYNTKDTPSLTDVEKVLAELARSDQRAYTLIRYLRHLAAGEQGEEKPIHELLAANKPVVIDLSRLPSHEHQVLYVDTLLRLVFNKLKRTGTEEAKALVIMIDEAHIFASKNAKNSIVPRMAAESRKYGTMLILATQQASTMSDQVLANIGTVIALRQNEPKEAHYIAQLLSPIREDEAIKSIEELLAELPTGEAIVRDYRDNAPLHIALWEEVRYGPAEADA